MPVPSPAPTGDVARLGVVFLPASGTPVGQFRFIVDAANGRHVEIGTLVTADTAEGPVVGSVVDMSSVGHGTDPFAADLLATGDPTLDLRSEVVVATVQVFWSPALRPVRAGVVRGATRDELARATGADRVSWGVPAGVVDLAGGGYAPVALDGAALLGPEAAHLMVGGVSGQASKTSFAGVLLRSAVAHAANHGRSLGAVIFNVKGDDLLFLDEPPAPGYELTDDDRAMYDAMGTPAAPFDDVTVFAPGLPGGTGHQSNRSDASVLRWDLRDLWPYLRYLLPNMSEDEKLVSFFAEFRERLLNRRTNPVDTFDKLRAWFDETLSPAADDAEGDAHRYPWGTHHRATLYRVQRMLLGLQPRCGGLLAGGASNPSTDVPTTGWTHGRVVVVDIAGLNPDVQGVVVARTTERLLDAAENAMLGVDHLVLFCDELNSFAPAVGGDLAAVRRVLARTSSTGRYAGISLWGAAQKLSRIDEQVRDNASTRALGMTADAELATGTYGRLPGGTAERIATLPKGRMVLWHYTLRSALVTRFPRPAWRTGKAKTKASGGFSKTDPLGYLGLPRAHAEALTEGLSAAAVADIVTAADDPVIAAEALRSARVPDAHRIRLTAPTPDVDPDDPFAL
jgi:hypothetical protein